MFSPYAVANSFLALAQRDGVSITNLKMQKLVYFANGVCLAMTGQPLVREQFEAWTYGPVLRSLYSSLNIFGSSPIAVQRLEPCMDFVSPGSLEERCIESVWNRFSSWTASQLVTLSHAEGSPWKKAWQKGGRFTPLSNEEIRAYFTPRP